MLEKDSIQYRSESNVTVNGQRISETNFSVPLAILMGLRYEADKGGRLRMEVMLPKGGKEERKTFNFFPAEARTRKQFSPEKFVVDCSECPPSMEAIYQILMRLMNK